MRGLGHRHPRADDRPWTFQHHPGYQGQTVPEVWLLLSAQVRADQVSWQHLQTGGTPTRDARARLNLLWAEWGAFGSDWWQAEPAQVAAVRLRAELAREWQLTPWPRRLVRWRRRPRGDTLADLARGAAPDMARQDQRGAPRSPRAVAVPSGNPEFRLHPQYRGWRYQRVWARFLDEARQAQFEDAALRHRTDAPAMARRAALDATWGPLGGVAWRHLEPMHLAAERVRQAWAQEVALAERMPPGRGRLGKWGRRLSRWVRRT